MNREDYLTKHEENLLNKLSNTFDSLNRNVIATFSLLLVFLLFKFNLLDDAEIAGLKLKVTQDQALILFPIVIAIPYFLINNAIFRIANIIDMLKTNSNEILSLNAEARPFHLEDLFYLTDGLAGLQLSLSKWIVEHLLAEKLIVFNIKIPTKKNLVNVLEFTLLLPFRILRSVQQLGNKFLYTVLFIILLVSIYILPIGTSIFILWNNKLNAIFQNFNFQTDLFNHFFWEAIFLLLLVMYTLVANLFLYSFYFTKLTKLKDDLVNHGYQNLVNGFTKIVHYYKGK